MFNLSASEVHGLYDSLQGFQKEIELDIEQRAEKLKNPSLSERAVFVKSRRLVMEGLKDLQIKVNRIYRDEKYRFIVDNFLKEADSSFLFPGGLFGRVEKIISGKPSSSDSSEFLS